MRSELLDAGVRVLSRVPHGDAEVIVTQVDSSLTRFADNAIHQNVAESSMSLRLRLQHQGRVGVASTRGGVGDLDAAIDRLVDNAEEARRLAPVSEGMPPLPQPLNDAGNA